MLFLAVAVATALLYAFWALWVPLLPANLYTPLLDLGKITDYTWRSAATYLALVLALFILYGLGYRAVAARHARIGIKRVLVSAGVFCALLLWAYPATAVDVFAYIADGQLLAVHHVNPFVVAPNAFPRDAILDFLAFPDEPSQYGPAWALLGGALTRLIGTDLLHQVLAYKAVAAAAHLLSAAVIYRIARRLTRGQSAARASAYLFAWNPLLLWEMVGNAHNDGLMMLFGLIGVWLFVAGHDRFALPAIVAGALIKAPIALIGPVMLVGSFRRNWARAIEGALLAVALAIVVYWPFWAGPRTVTALQRGDLFTASLGSVLRLALAPGIGLDNASTFARVVSLSAFAVVAVISLLLAARAETDAERLRPAYYTLLGALLLLTTWFQAWYVVWPFGLGAALAEPRRHLEVALLSLGGLLQYFVFIYLWVIGVFPQGENLGVQVAAYVAIVGPLLVMVALRAAARSGLSTRAVAVRV